MKKMTVIQISILILLAGSLGGMFVFTNVYDDVESGIVRVLCLSCIKLEPKTNIEFTFNTVDNEPHPSFILENLTKGPVFLHYSEDACQGCDVMYPVIKDLFDVSGGIKKSGKKIHEGIPISEKRLNEIFVEGEPTFVFQYIADFMRKLKSTGKYPVWVIDEVQMMDKVGLEANPIFQLFQFFLQIQAMKLFVI